jgi:hypothetical protein
LTNAIITGTSINGLMTAANTAPLLMPNTAAGQFKVVAGRCEGLIVPLFLRKIFSGLLLEKSVKTIYALWVRGSQ